MSNRIGVVIAALLVVGLVGGFVAWREHVASQRRIMDRLEQDARDREAERTDEAIRRKGVEPDDLRETIAMDAFNALGAELVKRDHLPTTRQKLAEFAARHKGTRAAALAADTLEKIEANLKAKAK